MIYLPIAVFWGLALWALFSARPALLYLFFAAMPFGSFAVLPTALTGGLTFTALPVVTLLLILRTFARRDGPGVALGMALRLNRLLLLFLFGIVAVIVTLFMPRVFAGMIQIVPIRGDLDQVAPLAPSPQNLSQLFYLVIAVASVFAFARLLQSEWVRQQAFQAMCLGGFLTVLTGLLDFASSYVPITPLLALFRTASYALITDLEVFGSKRVTGLMPEASAYGGVCIAFLCGLYFYRRAMTSARFRDVYVPVVLALLLLCIWLSKSSGAYIGLVLFFVVAAVEWAMRSHARGSDYRRGLAGELGIVICFVIAASLVLLLKPDLLEPVYQLLDRMVFQKGDSDSYQQRGMWRDVALGSVLQSYGLGIGLGSARTSSSIVAVLSGTGIPGAFLFYAFLVQSLLRGNGAATQEVRLIHSAFRFSFIPGFIVGGMVGDADFGGMMAFGFGLVAALSIRSSRKQMAGRLVDLLPVTDINGVRV